MLKWLTPDYLTHHPNYFVIYDNRAGDMFESNNMFGFKTAISTSLCSTDYDSMYYKPSSYRSIFISQFNRFVNNILLQNRKDNIERVYILAPVGRGRHNRFHIYENVIFPSFFKLLKYREIRWLNFWNCDCYDGEQFYINLPWLSCWDKSQAVKDNQIIQETIDDDTWKNPNDVNIHHYK